MLKPHYKRQRFVAWLTLAVALCGFVGIWVIELSNIRIDAFVPSMQNPNNIVGVFHVHSHKSHDSRLSYERIALAAKNLGLQFVILTDHNQQDNQSSMVDDVHVLSFAELSTAFGHTVQLGAATLPSQDNTKRPTIHRLIREHGGLSIITHPSDTKRPWLGSFDEAGGLEIANLAASARRLGRPWYTGLVPIALAALVNTPLALTQLYDRDNAALTLWDQHPAFLGLCGSDAHGIIPIGINLQAWYVVLPDASASILDHIRRGNFYCSAGVFGRDIDFKFRLSNNTLIAHRPAHPHIPMRMTLFYNGQATQHIDTQDLVYQQPAAGTYRIEVLAKIPGIPNFSSDHWVPIIYSNRVHVDL